jgi:hypothetical protein
MTNKNFLYGILAAVFALSLAGADVAGAYCSGGVCGPRTGSGRGSCYVQAGKNTCPHYQQGRGRKRGQRSQQCLRYNNCPVAQADSTPATQPAPVPSSN